MKSNTEFNKYKVKNDELYLPKSGGKVEGEAIFTGGVRFSSGDPKNDLIIKDKRSLGTATGHEYDLEFNNDLDEVTLTEDSQNKTILPLVATYNGTRANWNNLSAAEQVKYRHVIFTDETGSDDISGKAITYTSSDTTDANATSWTSVSKLTSGLSLGTLFGRVSQMFKNVRYLYKILGTTDLSAIGGGTVTDILKTANTDITNLKSGKSNLLVRRGKTASYSLSANGGASVSITDTLSGYTCIYAVIVGSDYGDYCPINQSGISLGNGTVTVSGYVKSFGSSAFTLVLRLESLWVKNT